MYQKDPCWDNAPETSSGDSEPDPGEWQNMRVVQNLPIAEADLTESLSLFFKYQHPQFMFIDRDAFLGEYHSNAQQGKYCSYPLLYSLCALGARASGDARIREKASLLSHFAETMTISQSLTCPHITVAQSLLCLAFYELAMGNHSKGWLLAGMAFRMGQDLGLQQDPRFLASQDSKIASEQDLQIRRRIYWGMYVADK